MNVSLQNNPAGMLLSNMPFQYLLLSSLVAHSHLKSQQAFQDHGQGHTEAANSSLHMATTNVESFGWKLHAFIFIWVRGPSGLYELLGFQNSMKINIAQEAELLKQTKGKCACPIDKKKFLLIMMSPDLLIIMLCLIQ